VWNFLGVFHWNKMVYFLFSSNLAPHRSEVPSIWYRDNWHPVTSHPIFSHITTSRPQICPPLLQWKFSQLSSTFWASAQPKKPAPKTEWKHGIITFQGQVGFQSSAICDSKKTVYYW
jgi:hypothetical protein